MYEDELRKISPNDWELFAQDVLFHLGFEILIGPSEGLDGGLDLKVKRGSINYLVSCKHFVTSGKNVGVKHEIDIRDRLERHECTGFIPFYSTGITTQLNEKFISLRRCGISVFEIYKDHVLDVIPTMSGFILQKYFSRPHELYQHKYYEAEYKPLMCLEKGCHKDLLEGQNINSSLASLYYHEAKKEIGLVYGCKNCTNKYLGDWEWVELTQIRYLEQLLRWRAIIDKKFADGYVPDEDFFKNWSLLQEAMSQVLVPPGWGKWLPDGWDMSILTIE